MEVSRNWFAKQKMRTDGRHIGKGPVPARQNLGAAAAGERGAPLRITALVPDAATCLDSLKAARAAAAIDAEARITALHVQVDPQHLVTSAEELAIQQLRAIREGTSRERRDRTYDTYSKWLRSIGDYRKPVEWRERVGAEEALVDEECADVDLIAVARPISLDGHDALHAALFRHRHLVLFVPPLGDVAEPVIGRVMVIAWKPNERTLDAIVRAMPWLRKAGLVHLVTVDRDDIEEAVALLKDNDIGVQIHRIAKGEGSVGNTLSAYATTIDADCLVMGAYRHGPFLESLLGGVTHDVLHRGHLPAFIVH